MGYADRGALAILVGAILGATGIYLLYGIGQALIVVAALAVIWGTSTIVCASDLEAMSLSRAQSKRQEREADERRANPQPQQRFVS